MDPARRFAALSPNPFARVPAHWRRFAGESADSPVSRTTGGSRQRADGVRRRFPFRQIAPECLFFKQIIRFHADQTPKNGREFATMASCAYASLSVAGQSCQPVVRCEVI